MSKIYDVPVVAQTSHNTCWHASSLMIWNYWQGVTHKQGPMNTLVKNYSLDKPITALDFIVLAGKTGLKKVDLKYNDYTSEILESLLKKYGPLWCAGTWYGGGHIIVLTGVDKEKIFLNDPANGGSKKTNTVKWFNNKLSKSSSSSIMYKDPIAY